MEDIEELQQWIPFAMTIVDADCGSEFINHDVAGSLQAHDIAQELELLNRLWRLVSLRLNFFTPTKKPIGYTTYRPGPPHAHLRQAGHPVAAPTGIGSA